MDHVIEILRYLIEKNKKWVINITKKEKEIIVNIWSGKRCKRFKSTDAINLEIDLRRAYSI